MHIQAAVVNSGHDQGASWVSPATSMHTNTCKWLRYVAQPLCLCSSLSTMRLHTVPHQEDPIGSMLGLGPLPMHMLPGTLPQVPWANGLPHGP